ncbi:unnamed protein product [Paramecium sonneborni]|uniref:Uncharacterized protein n=1 Tax=Paramecium sonneborni TaxID=65129 RepID=A0A8S1RT08_9CILI|nr:unnamed protein product [Paramecium sonneborni]
MNSVLVNILFSGVLSQTQQLFYYDVKTIIIGLKQELVYHLLEFKFIQMFSLLIMINSVQFGLKKICKCRERLNIKIYQRLCQNRDEIVVSENVQLKYAQRFDTPILIQSIANVYVKSGHKIIQNQISLFRNYIFIFMIYKIIKNVHLFQIIKNSLKIQKPFITLNNEIIVIVWQSDFGIIASKFSLKYISAKIFYHLIVEQLLFALQVIINLQLLRGSLLQIAEIS